MWTQKLLLVLVLISVSQANPLHQKLIMSSANEDQNSDRRYVLDDVDEIPSGPHFSYVRVKEASDKPVHREPVKPTVLEYSPVSITINLGKGKAADDEEQIAHVPAGQLEQRQHIEIPQARDLAPENFPGGDGSRGAPDNFGEPARRSERISAGLQLFGFPIGPQFSKSSTD